MNTPTIQLLGPLTVTGPGKRPQSPARAIELVTFLALHPRDDHELLDQALWPHRRISTQTRSIALHQARTWLGSAPDTHPYICFVNDAGYRLHPHLSTDWDTFTATIGPDPAGASTTALTTALSLVHGQPLSGTNPSRYAWAELDRQTMIATIADAADELTTRALTTRQARIATWAAAIATTVEPANEHYWRQRLRAAAASADPDQARRAIHQLHTTLQPLGELEPETEELIGTVAPTSHTSTPTLGREKSDGH